MTGTVAKGEGGGDALGLPDGLPLQWSALPHPLSALGRYLLSLGLFEGICCFAVGTQLSRAKVNYGCRTVEDWRKEHIDVGVQR